MPISNALPRPETPDLLRRFIATPFECRLVCRGMEFRLESNKEVIQTSPNIEKISSSSFTGRLIFDPDLPPALESPLVVPDGQIVYITFGTACMLAVNVFARELNGFISGAVDLESLEQEILPAVVAVAEPRR